MDLRDSFSRLKKKLRDPLRGRKSKPDRTVGGVGGERVDPADLLLRSDSHVTASNTHNIDEGGPDAGGRQAHSTDRLPQPADRPKPVPARESDYEQEGGKSDVDGREANQACPHLHSGVEVAAGSGPNREGNEADGRKVERVCPSPSTLSILRGGGSHGMWTWLFLWLLALTLPRTV